MYQKSFFHDVLSKRKKLLTDVSSPAFSLNRMQAWNPVCGIPSLLKSKSNSFQCMSLSAFRLQSSLEADINAQMYQKSILDDELSKNNELITDVSSLA
jgi:hypothetical protein